MKHSEKTKELIKNESQFAIAYKLGISIPTLVKRLEDNEFTLSQAAKIDKMWNDLMRTQKQF